MPQIDYPSLLLKYMREVHELSDFGSSTYLHDPLFDQSRFSPEELSTLQNLHDEILATDPILAL